MSDYCRTELADPVPLSPVREAQVNTAAPHSNSSVPVVDSFQLGAGTGPFKLDNKPLPPGCSSPGKPVKVPLCAGKHDKSLPTLGVMMLPGLFAMSAVARQLLAA